VDISALGFLILTVLWLHIFWIAGTVILFLGAAPSTHYSLSDDWLPMSISREVLVSVRFCCVTSSLARAYTFFSQRAII